MRRETTRIKRDFNQQDSPLKIEGNLFIQGDVLEKTEIQVGGDLRVSGIIQRAKIETNRHLVVGQGVTDRSEVKVNGSVKSGFIENSVVHSRGDIIIQNSVMRATLHAGRNILLSDGVMIGGSASATEKIVIQKLGSSAGVPTYLSVGIHPKIRIKYGEIQSRIEEIDKELQLLAKNIRFLEETDINDSTSQSYQSYLQLPQIKSKQKKYQRQWLLAKKNLHQLLTLAESRWPDNPHVLVRDTVFEKVQISIGWNQFLTTEILKKVAFKYKNDAVCIVNLA